PAWCGGRAGPARRQSSGPARERSTRCPRRGRRRRRGLRPQDHRADLELDARPRLMELLALAGRVVLSLAVVLALLWFAARGLRKNQRRSLRGVDVEVLARQPLAQRSSLAVVQVGERALVLGVTESRVELLYEQPLDEVLAPGAT